jgi:hypothetical protein
MSDSLFKDDDNRGALRDAGIGGLRADDDLSRKAAEAMKNMQRQDAIEEAERRQREREAAPRRSLDDFDLRRGTVKPAEQPAGTGTGRPVQRGPHLANVFTITRGNDKYLTGKSESPASGALGFIGMMAFVAVVFGFIFAVSSTDSPGRKGFGEVFVIIIGINLLMAVFMVRSIMQARYFARHGQLLVGSVTSASGRWVTTGSGKNRSRKYKVSVGYALSLPNGETIHKTETHNRNDLARGGLPEPGTPIAVLWVPENGRLRLL